MRTHLPERNLDVLRAVAVLSVLLDHVLTTWGGRVPFVSVWELGRLGVLLFFVHTSLVLMSSLERNGEKGHWVRAFYIRRAFRIYPLAIAAIWGAALLGVSPHVTPGMAGGPPDSSVPTLIANVALAQNIAGRPDILGVLWSLPIEVQMYALLPLAFIIANRGVSAALGGLIGVGALGLAVQSPALPGLWRFSMFTFGPCFMSGVLAYAILRYRREPVLPGWSWGLVLLACVPFLTVLRPTAASPERGWLFCLAVGCAIPAVRELSESWVIRVAHAICTHSYGLYLLHVPALWLSFFVLRNAPVALQWLAFGILVVTLPVLAYRFIEEPGIRLGKRLSDPEGGRREVRVAKAGDAHYATDTLPADAC